MFIAMTSPKSSVGSKSSAGHLQYYQKEGSGGSLRSSWISRLHLRPTPPPSPIPATEPTQVTTGEDPPPVVAPAAMNSLCTTGAGGVAMVGFRKTTSTHESRTPSSVSNARASLFFRHLLKLRREQPRLRTNHKIRFSGFGPFQVRRRSLVERDKGSSSTTPPSSWNKLPGPAFADADRLRHQVLQFGEAGGACGEAFFEQKLGHELDGVKRGGIGDLGLAGQDSAAGLGEGWNFNHGRNSRGDVCFPTFQRMTGAREEEEEEMRENNFLPQHNRLPPNRRALFTGETLFASESNFVNNNNCSERAERIVSVQQRELVGDRYSIPLSPFFRYWSASEKQDYLKENRPNGFTFAPSGEDSNKFMDSNLDSRNMNHPWPVGGESRCSPSSRFPIAYQRLYKRRLSVGQCPTTTAFRDMNYLSRNRGVTHESDDDDDDDDAGRTSRDPHLTHRNVALRRQEKQASACPNEIEEPFNSWKIDRLKRAEMVSSIFQSYRSGSRKRNSVADEYVSGKSRKLGPGDAAGHVTVCRYLNRCSKDTSG